MTQITSDIINRGILSLQNQQFDEAEKQFQAALDLQADNIDALRLLGILKRQQGLLETADDFLHQAKQQCLHKIQAEPANIQLCLLLAAIYLDIGNLSDAEESYRACIKINPDNTDAYNGLGSMYFKQGKIQKAYSMFYQSLKKDGNSAETLYNQGVVLRSLGQLQEAELSLRQAVALAPSHIAALGSLGLTLQELGKQAEAVVIYEGVLNINPQDSFASHMLSAIKGDTTEKAPGDFVRGLFDSYAPAYEKHLQETLQFQAPELINSALDDNCHALLPFSEVLDLGCGTGLMAEKLGARADNIDGVDLAQKMLLIAQNKGLYRSLQLSDIDDFLESSATLYDCCIASDVFIYLGDLQATFLAVNASLKDEGIFAFTTELSEEEDYILLSSGRYAHSTAYINKIANDSGFVMNAQKLVNLRKEEDSWVKGCVYIFTKLQ